MHEITQKIHSIFEKNGNKNYGVEPVTQLQHALQGATLAVKEEADEELVVAALLHDIGHIMFEDDIPESVSEDLHDHHEEKAYHWVLEHFGARIADPVRMHVAAKRYLCTVDDDYVNQLSETSRKSFFDQGGVMSKKEKTEFESEVHFNEALRLRRWDDLAKDPNAKTKTLDYFIPLIENCLHSSDS